ncbi:lysophospholipid acyltransferase family protein [Algoriphagus aquimarinus]|uniref:KDO2-lipid IV(A) lauroyltransferase n=1 Tax=Algoriphagus aquimarinus TaxID=237018 RepID=A0A1I0WHT6_9BACT|nr:lysophospholipid acyltransferase family protein [Algoriphagus aquimarinus]SFA87506.1 KDO2-lipid IV(A) lauroyltransferase [Algoriphagus aquimarinus]|tara:strand:- start:129087 stop:129923 length:837 start_codon:yes stop_codon:yes gene_type:complete
MFAIRLISRLPLSILYLLSDILYLVARFGIKYRKEVIDENLKFAFPEKSDAECKSIRNKFYRNFTDSFAETIKLLTISEQEFEKRFQLVNTDFLEEAASSGTSVLLVSGHLFNWEMGVIGINQAIQTPVETVYLKVNNPFFNNLINTIRTHFGGIVTEKRCFRRTMLTLAKSPRVVLLGSDQRPPSSEKRYKRDFLNRPAVFFEGAEFLSKKMNLHIIYGKMTKIKRGHYRYEMIKLAEPPFDKHLEHSITDKFCEMLEDNIRLQPDLYLWSHKRWKI